MNTIERLRELLAKATPGEWKIGTDEWKHPVIMVGKRSGKVGVHWYLAMFTAGRPGKKEGPDNAALIAAMRNALPALLDVAEASAKYVRVANADAPGYAAYKEAVDELDAALAKLEDVE